MPPSGRRVERQASLERKVEWIILINEAIMAPGQR
jgi:hypothetical protein